MPTPPQDGPKAADGPPREERKSLAAAYAVCEQLAREHYENFPVASVLLPKRMRPAIAAIYAFARRADDFADEPGYDDAERLRLLDDWSRRLHGCVDQSPRAGAADPAFLALGDTIRTYRLPLSLFDDLLSAFRQDVTVKRYRSWPDVLDYCRRSANPVGRLVLRVAGYHDEGLDRASDAVCTALQLTNFWQDLARDWANGRLYVPLDDRDGAGALDGDLDAGRLTPAWQDALRTVSARTRDLFAAGRPVCDGVGGRLKLELRATWLGGVRILDRLEQAEFDVFRRRPRLAAGDALPILWRAATWKAA
ncbi:MAG: squalene synthase HpnC [Vicinamibacterales bacterium]